MLSHRQQPTRLPRPWDSPGKNTGVGCHFHLQFMKVKSESEVTQSCPTLHDLMDCSLPGSSIHGIFQARVLERGAIAFSTSQVVQWKKKICLPLQETCLQPLGQDDPLEEEMATHSSILVWRIPCTRGLSDGLQLMALQRVRHDQATDHAQQ